MSNSRKPAPLKRESKQPIKTSTYDTISNNCHVTVKQPPVMATQIQKAMQSTHAADRMADILPMPQSKTSAWENIPACIMEERFS